MTPKRFHDALLNCVNRLPRIVIKIERHEQPHCTLRHNNQRSQM
jgi:hypothetical protein